MALIRVEELRRIDKHRNTVHKSVEETYTTFQNKLGKNIFNWTHMGLVIGK